MCKSICRGLREQGLAPTRQQVWAIANQLAAGVEYLESMSVLHLDLKVRFFIDG